MGNGAAMRVAPLGAFFADDPALAADEARASAEVTHAHPEGQAGAVAVAMAAVWTVRHRALQPDALALLRYAAEHTPAGETRHGIARALEIPASVEVAEAAEILGNGSGAIAADTVPYSLWCAAHNLGDFRAALWAAVAAGGDRDTNCAIVGGIVALHVGIEGIPEAWRATREPLAVARGSALLWRHAARGGIRVHLKAEEVSAVIQLRIESYLRDAGLPYLFLPDPRARSAQEAAEAEHVSGWQVAKTIAVELGSGEEVICVVPAPASWTSMRSAM